MSYDALVKVLGISEDKILHVVKLRARCMPHDQIIRAVGGVAEKQIDGIIEIIESNDHVLRPKYLEFQKEWENAVVAIPIAQRKRQFEMYQALYDQAQDELKKLEHRQSHIRSPNGLNAEGKAAHRAAVIKRCEDLRLRYMDVALNALESARKATTESLKVDKGLFQGGSAKDMVQKILRDGKELMESNVITKKEWMSCLPLSTLNRTQ